MYAIKYRSGTSCLDTLENIAEPWMMHVQQEERVDGIPVWSCSWLEQFDNKRKRVTFTIPVYNTTRERAWKEFALFIAQVYGTVYKCEVLNDRPNYTSGAQD